MQRDHPQPRSRLPAHTRAILGVALAVLAAAAGPAAGQEAGRPPLQLNGVAPAGVRTTATEGWGLFDVRLTNRGDADRQARVLLYYAGQADVQYGRDVWVPARSALATWVVVGPAAPQESRAMREVHALLYDRTGGQDRLVPAPGGGQPHHPLTVQYRKREPFTVVLTDEEPEEGIAPGRPPVPDPPGREAVLLARAFRRAADLSDTSQVLRPDALPATAEAFGAVDHVVVASNAIKSNPVGLRALRQWLEQGGRVWVMLDLVDPDAVAPLLGDALDFALLDRVGLTTFRLETPGPAGPMALGQPQEHERPVGLARVLLPAHEPVRQAVGGWPAWFTRRVGRGKVVFTTLGPRAWFRGGAAGAGRAGRFASPGDLPVPSAELNALAAELRPAGDGPFPPSAFRALLAGEVGYAVVGRGTAALVFAGGLLAALGLGVVLRRSPRPEVLGWVGPAAALAAAGVFFALGEIAHRGVPPTLAAAEVVEAVPGTDEVAVHGLLAVYRPDAGPAELGAAAGGHFEPDTAGVEGQARRRIVTDLDGWHWENLALPAGVREAPFRIAVPSTPPVEAVARLGPAGLEGSLRTGPYHDLEDAVLHAPDGRNLAVRLRPDGTFTAGPGDVLPEGQYLAGAVLSDWQQRRLAVYRECLKASPTGPTDDRPILLAWAPPIDLHFSAEPAGRRVGDALLVIPLRLERGPPGRVTVPGPLIPCQQVRGVGLTRPTMQSNAAIDLHLRFQLPTALLPFRAERARLAVKVEAPGRPVAVAGVSPGGPVELLRVEGPREPLRLEVTEPRVLALDGWGGLHLQLSVGDPGPGAARDPSSDKGWRIESIHLDVDGTAGRTEGEKK